MTCVLTDGRAGSVVVLTVASGEAVGAFTPVAPDTPAAILTGLVAHRRILGNRWRRRHLYIDQLDVVVGLHLDLIGLERIGRRFLLDQVTIGARVTGGTLTPVAVHLADAQAVEARIGVALLDADAAIFARVAALALAVVGRDAIGRQVAGGRLAGSAVVARAGEHIHLDVNADGRIARVADQHVENLVRDERESIGHGPPSQQTVRRDPGVALRFGQSEVQRIAFRI